MNPDVPFYQLGRETIKVSDRSNDNFLFIYFKQAITILGKKFLILALWVII